MWLYLEQVHDSMQLYVVSIPDNVCLSLTIDILCISSTESIIKTKWMLPVCIIEIYQLQYPSPASALSSK